jgi:hypothetical protein
MVVATGSLNVVVYSLDVQPLLHLGLRRKILLQQFFFFISFVGTRNPSSNQFLSSNNFSFLLNADEHFAQVSISARFT